MSFAITARMASVPVMLACFTDEALLRGALAFERALAAASAEHGVIGADAAAAIATACDRFDSHGLADAAAHAGTLAIPLVARLRDAVPTEHAAAVHRGATSQDVADTALVLQIRDARGVLDLALAAIAARLATIARAHATTVVRGRTLLQPADAITFGMRAANWLLGVRAAHERFTREADAALRVQLGGAVGSLAALGP
ncbi:MAG TPA: lyase family protein, partial [Kofleriaceae bacterium]|nr:lyase family protein [Kofleriaceae bacterium]